MVFVEVEPHGRVMCCKDLEEQIMHGVTRRGRTTPRRKMLTHNKNYHVRDKFGQGQRVGVAFVGVIRTKNEVQRI